MATEESGTPPTLSWVNQFKAEHPIESLPQEVRPAFSALLARRAGIRDYYVAFPAERIDETIGRGNTAKEDLIDLIGTSRIRNKALQEGALTNWRYGEVDPEGLAKLQTLNKDQIIEQLDAATRDLFDLIAQPSTDKIISLPYGVKASVPDVVWGANEHEVLHLGFAIKFGDYFSTPEKPVERPVSVKKLYG